MANTILAQILSLINLGSTLEAAVETVIPGADPIYWQRLISREQNKPQAKPRKSTKRTSNGKPRKTFNYAAQVLARTSAMAELVERVNGAADDSQPDPQSGYEVIINGEPTLWADTPDDAHRIYSDYYTSRPVIWTVNGQSVELEVEL